MRYRWLIILSFALFSVSTGERVSAQSEPDRIIAGEYLAKLWDALKAGSVAISNSELNSQITGKKLSAIVIPHDQSQNIRVIKRCFQEKTTFDIPDFPVSQDDYAQLIKYAKDGVFLRAKQIRTSLSAKDEAGLEAAKSLLRVELNSRPASERGAATRFAGALLADLEPTDPLLASYVSAFREHTEKSVMTQLKTDASLRRGLSPRTPYSWGSSDFLNIDVWKVNPSAVGEFTIGNSVFRKTWVGSTYILVYQDGSPAPRDRSGLGLSKDWGSGDAVAGTLAPKLELNGPG